MPRKHPEPTGTVELDTYRDLDPVLTVGGVAAYFGVTKQLAAKWARVSPDWPEPFAYTQPPQPGEEKRSGALYRTTDVIAWAKAHERRRAEGPREPNDPRPPSAKKAAAKRRPRAAA